MSLSSQFWTMAHMFLAGIYLGAVFDTFFRLRGPGHPSWLKVLEDLLFWLLNGVLVFLWLMAVNQGQMRFVVLVFIACGYAAYKGLLSPFYLKGLDWFLVFLAFVYRSLTRFVSWVLWVIIFPVRLLWRLIASIFSFLFMGMFLGVKGILQGGRILASPLTKRWKERRAKKKGEEKKGFIRRIANNWFSKKN